MLPHQATNPGVGVWCAGDAPPPSSPAHQNHINDKAELFLVLLLQDQLSKNQVFYSRLSNTPQEQKTYTRLFPLDEYFHLFQLEKTFFKYI